MKFTILGCYRHRSGTGFPAALCDRRRGSTAELDRIGDRLLRARARVCPDRRVLGLKASVQRDLRQHRVCDEPMVPVNRQTPVFADSLKP